MRLLKNLLASLAALLMLAMLTVYLTPLDAYVPRVEQALAKRLDEPVRIGRITLAALPLPHLELHDVHLGEREAIAAQSVDIELDMPSLLIERRAVVRRIFVRDGAAHLEAVRKLAEVFADPSAVSAGIAVRELDLSGMSLQAAGIVLGPLEGKLAFGQTGRLQSAWLAMDERKMTVNLVPMPERRLYMEIQAREWTPPRLQQFPWLAEWRMDSLQLESVLSERDFIALKFAADARGISLAGSGKVEFADGWRVKANVTGANAPLERVMALLGNPAELTGTLSAKGRVSATAKVPGELKEHLAFDGEVHASGVSARIAAGFRQPFVFDEISARVDAGPGHLMLSGLQAKLYGGGLTGEMGIDRRKAVLEADLAANGIAMRPLVEALTNEVLVTGAMDGSAKLSMHLGGFERFPENMRSSGNFHMRNGTLTKVDLVQAASNPGEIYTRGGATRFDDLTGLFKVDAAGYHFRKVKISSGSLNAEGNVDISPSWQLKGMLEADVKGTAGLVSMPMAVSGTVSDPVVRPSGSALAGAAVGTAILGPGLGTAVGIRIGGFLNKLFGRNEDKNNGKQAAPAVAPKK
jgi:hypothetical protein